MAADPLRAEVEKLVWGPDIDTPSPAAVEAVLNLISREVGKARKDLAEKIKRKVYIAIRPGVLKAGDISKAIDDALQGEDHGN